MAGDMAFDMSRTERVSAGWTTIIALAQADGSAAHRTPMSLVQPRAPARIVADAIHLIGMLHGRHPGIVDHALTRPNQGVEHLWLEHAADAFAAERSYLARLVSAVGPVPSTPGQAESETAVIGQRHALDTLAQSDRQGCALGAAVALVLDWHTIRTILDTAAERLALATPACFLPDKAETAAMVSSMATGPAAERALAFGAQQVLAQHRGLWDLVDARASARGDT